MQFVCEIQTPFYSRSSFKILKILVHLVSTRDTDTFAKKENLMNESATEVSFHNMHLQCKYLLTDFPIYCFTVTILSMCRSSILYLLMKVTTSRFCFLSKIRMRVLTLNALPLLIQISRCFFTSQLPFNIQITLTHAFSSPFYVNAQIVFDTSVGVFYCVQYICAENIVKRVQRMR